jgi:hypothetical protein
LQWPGLATFLVHLQGLCPRSQETSQPGGETSRGMPGLGSAPTAALSAGWFLSPAARASCVVSLMSRLQSRTASCVRGGTRQRRRTRCPSACSESTAAFHGRRSVPDIISISVVVLLSIIIVLWC